MHKTHTVAKTPHRKKNATAPGLRANFSVINSVHVWAVVETRVGEVRRGKQCRDLSA